MIENNTEHSLTTGFIIKKFDLTKFFSVWQNLEFWQNSKLFRQHLGYIFHIVSQNHDLNYHYALNSENWTHLRLLNNIRDKADCLKLCAKVLRQ